MEQHIEYWLSGPVEDIPVLLQPVAHALLQAQFEIHQIMHGIDQDLLNERPAGMASPAFHLLHIPGVIDRLFTYAEEKDLSETQLAYLKNESIPDSTITNTELLKELDHQIEKALNQLKEIKEESLTEVRYVGRKKIPSTLLGLLFHAAEHTQRHTGQLLVTISILKQNI